MGVIKGQASFEFLLLAAFIFVAFGTGLFFVFNYFNDSVDDFKISRLESIGRNIVEKAEVLSVRGVGSRSSFSFEAPVDIVDFSNFNDDFFMIRYHDEGNVLKNFSIPLNFPVKFFGNFNFAESTSGVISLDTYSYGVEAFVVATPFNRCDPGTFSADKFDILELSSVNLNECSEVSRSNPGDDLEWFENLCFYFDSNNDCSLTSNELKQGQDLFSALDIPVNPILIDSAWFLYWDMYYTLGGDFVLVADIDLSGFDPDSDSSNGNWIPLGDASNKFAGGFYGNGYSISGLNINLSGSSDVGFFGVAENARIYDANISGVVIGRGTTGGLIGFGRGSSIVNSSFYGVVNGSSDVGGLIGTAGYSSISDSSFYGVVNGSSSKVGGLIGRSDATTVSSSSSSGSVEGRERVGGLVGHNSGIVVNGSSSSDVYSTAGRAGGLLGRSSSGSVVNNSFSSGDVFATGGNVGGLIGELDKSSVFSSFSSGSVSVTGSNVGGFIGFVEEDSNVSSSFSSGSVSVTGGNVGGLIGFVDEGGVSSSFSSSNVSATGKRVGGLIGMAGKATTLSYPLVLISNSFSDGGFVNGSSRVGGLIGHLYQGSDLSNSFSSVDVSGSSRIGGLVGEMSNHGHHGSFRGPWLSNSFSYGQVSGSSDIGGLVGFRDLTGPKCTGGNYWDTVTSGQSSDDCGVGKSTSELQTPTSNTGIFSSWDSGVWDFGTSSEYPSLKFG